MLGGGCIARKDSLESEGFHVEKENRKLMVTIMFTLEMSGTSRSREVVLLKRKLIGDHEENPINNTRKSTTESPRTTKLTAPALNASQNSPPRLNVLSRKDPVKL